MLLIFLNVERFTAVKNEYRILFVARSIFLARARGRGVQLS